MGGNTKKNQIAKSPKQKQRKSVASFSGLKWALVFLILIGAIVANVYYAEVAWAVRTAIGILVFLLLASIAFQTSQGQIALDFIKASRTEIRKVVWPTRQETVHTALIVVAMVVFSAIVLWGLDSFFFWLVGWLAGQRG